MPLETIASDGRASDAVNGTRDPLTRNCMDAWMGVDIHADGSVGPCCILAGYAGSLKNNTLLEILNGPKMKQLRGELLRGDLDESTVETVRTACARCILYERTTVSNLKAQLREHLRLVESA